jgi:hypothetical protein
MICDSHGGRWNALGQSARTRFVNFGSQKRVNFSECRLVRLLPAGSPMINPGWNWRWIRWRDWQLEMPWVRFLLTSTAKRGEPYRVSFLRLPGCARRFGDGHFGCRNPQTVRLHPPRCPFTPICVALRTRSRTRLWKDDPYSNGRDHPRRRLAQARSRGVRWPRVNGQRRCERVAPLGAYFWDNADRVIQEAARSALVTYTHPEGVASTVETSASASRCSTRTLKYVSRIFWVEAAKCFH